MVEKEPSIASASESANQVEVDRLNSLIASKSAEVNQLKNKRMLAMQKNESLNSSMMSNAANTVRQSSLNVREMKPVPQLAMSSVVSQ